MDEKRCISCTEVKPVADFYAHPQMGDGHLNKCKACCRRDARDNRNKNLERIREYDRNRPNREERLAQVRAWAHTPEGREITERSKQAWDARNPHKKKASGSVNSAVRTGRLNKPNRCERCGGSGKIEGHHPNYSKPLEVMWLCESCHKQEHKNRRAMLRRA